MCVCLIEEVLRENSNIKYLSANEPFLIESTFIELIEVYGNCNVIGTWQVSLCVHFIHLYVSKTHYMNLSPGMGLRERELD